VEDIMGLRKALAATVISGGLALGTAGAASAQPVVTGGLVNVTIVDVLSGNQTTLQVPITVAANICDVTVAVLAQDLSDGTADCSTAQQIITVSQQRRR
jgi:hypothetical protein